ncbi:sigma-70 family RNA polymerase sigma factor [Nocardioides marmoraquaticus]
MTTQPSSRTTKQTVTTATRAPGADFDEQVIPATPTATTVEPSADHRVSATQVATVPGPKAPRSISGQVRQARTRELFTECEDLDDEEQRQALHDEVIVMHLDLAHSEAKRYRSRGVPLDDLQQVAALALTKATAGYDVTTGHDFLSYAVPTIRGELRKHFRDHGWMVRPPRRIQELQARINRADGELSAALGRAPVPQEVADHLDEPVDSVIEALASDGCFVPASLDHPAGGGDGSTTLGDLLPLDDAEHRASEARLLLTPVLGHLSDRDRDIVAMRFTEGLTQREIAARIGVTQMQVSRLLGRILAQLRDDVGDVDRQ